MADPSQPFAEPMTFWGIVTRAAQEGRSAAAAQQLVTDEAARLGVRTSFATRTEVSSIYGQAVALRRASKRLASADPTDAIVSDYLAQLPYGTGGGRAAGARLFDVRVGYNAVRAGVPEQDYITLRYTGGLPATVGELYAEAEDVAFSLVEGYGASFTGMGGIQIGELL